MNPWVQIPLRPPVDTSPPNVASKEIRGQEKNLGGDLRPEVFIMQTTVFAKQRTDRNNRKFYTYLAQLTVPATGEQLTVAVKFPEGKEPKPADCPMNIVFNKADANLSRRRYEKSSGEIGISSTLWVSDWEEGEPYVDHSLDDFE